MLQGNRDAYVGTKYRNVQGGRRGCISDPQTNPNCESANKNLPSCVFSTQWLPTLQKGTSSHHDGCRSRYAHSWCLFAALGGYHLIGLEIDDIRCALAVDFLHGVVNCYPKAKIALFNHDLVERGNWSKVVVFFFWDQVGNPWPSVLVPFLKCSDNITIAHYTFYV